MNRLRSALRVLFGRAFALEIPTGFDKDFSFDWDEDDQEWLQRVSNHGSGAKIFALLRHEVASTAIWAVNQNNSVRCCGYAAGAAYIVNLIESCLPNPEEKPAPLTDEERIEAEIAAAFEQE